MTRSMHTTADAETGATVRRRGDLLMSVALSAVLAAVIIVYARLDSLLGADIRIACFLLIFLMSIVGIFGTLAKGQFLPAAASIGTGVYIIFNLVLFSLNFGTAINLNAAFAFSPLVSIAFYKMAIDQLGPAFVMRRLFHLALAYALIYLSLSVINILAPATLPQAARDALILSEGANFRANVRADRIVGYLGLLMFGWFSALSLIVERPTARRLALGALFITCMALTNSRTFLACVVLVTIGVIFLRSPRPIFLLSIATLSITTLFFAGCIVTGSNPFLMFEYDGSGAVRLRSFETASYWIGQLPWFGVGTAPSLEIERYFIVGQEFSLTDLGPAGILYSHGVFGVILWLGAPLVRHLRNGVVAPANRAIYLTLSTMILYQVIAPVLWYGGGTAIFALWLATTFSKKV